LSGKLQQTDIRRSPCTKFMAGDELEEEKTDIGKG
jgi:hypothetical protein